MAKNQFVHLHCHSGGSVLDGHATIKELVAEAVALGQPGIAVTDHGNMHFAHELWQEAKNAGINGIVGIEAYMTPGDASRTEKAPIFFGAKTKEERLEGAQDVSAGGAYTHMTLLAENNEGMHNLFKLTSMAWKDGYYKKPRMDVESLANHSKGIIATTGCPSGELQTRLRLGQWDEAVKYVDKMQSIFGKENYFLELMDHDMKVDIERIVKDDLLKIGKHMNIPLLATNDLHYTRREQAGSHEQLLAVQSGSKMTDATYDNGGKRFAFSGEEFYVKSADEMEQVFGHLPESLTNTLLIAERCNVSFAYKDDLRPNVEFPVGMNETEFIRSETLEGLNRRLPQFANDKRYLDRINMELSVLDLKGYNGYFLVTSDFVRWAKNNGVEVGYGRGCLSADANVLTPTGFVKIKDIKVGDVVFNQYGEQIPVPEVFEYDCDEDLIEIKAFYGGNGNKMTADHKVLVSKAGTGAKPEWIRADEVSLNDYVVMPNMPDVAEMHQLPLNAVNSEVAGNQAVLDYFVDEDFHYYRVTEVNVVPSEGKVYDFTVPGAHSYVTDSYVVHNSAGGSLVSFCLDITDLDPIRHDLLFERFINPERDSPPDIDMDFDDIGRDRVIQYVTKKYGADKVAQIVTFGKIGAKQAIKDTIRVLDEPYALGDILTKAIPPAKAGKEMKLKELFDKANSRYEEGDNFREEAEKLYNKDIIPSALGLEGRMRSTGVHAAGVIISSKNLDESIPLFSRPKDGITITQFDYPTCEGLGLLKFDFLGIRNLTIVAKAIEHIKRRHGINLDAVELVNGPMDDKATYELFQRGDTLGIFQLDSGGMRSLLKLIRPTAINDILAVLALYRPGPMGMNSHIEYADRKNGRKPVVAPHPELKQLFDDVMGDTFGITCYQEQLMKSAQIVAGYSLAQADNLRRAMGKKKLEVLQKEYIPFSAGMKENGYSDAAVKALWDIFVPFAEYGFNKTLKYDTMVERVSSNQHETTPLISLQGIWDRFYGVDSKTHVGKKYRKQGLMIRGYNKDTKMITKKRVIDIHDHGVLKLWKITLDNGSVISASKNHRHMTPTGWKTVEELQVDDMLTVDTEAKISHLGDTYIRGDRSMGAGKDWINRTETRMIASDGYNRPAIHGINASLKAVKRQLPNYCEFCGEKEGRLEAAHLDNDRTNNTRENVKKLCNPCHKKHDRLRRGGPWSRGTLAGQSKIVSIEYDGEHQAYDLEVEGETDMDHNYVANGVVTHNSHSAGYALLSYVTGYLKANYGAEYMAALLSCTMGDKDKTAIYLEECRRMGIKVSAPDVSKSLTEYAPVTDKDILFGMEAIRGVGYEVAQGIVDTAKEKPFENLTDFMTRVPSSALSKGIIEGLIDGGGFDGFGHTRRSMAQRLPELAKNFSKIKKTEEKGQFDLFGALDDVEAPPIEIPELPEYTKKDKLARERHVLGLYVSDHPLSGMANTLDSYVSNHIVDIATGDLVAAEGFGDRKAKVTFAGVVGSLMRKPTRKGDMFASFTIEDMTGTVDAVMFPKNYEVYGHMLEPDGIFVATGSLMSRGEDEVNFAVDSLEIIETTATGEIPFIIRLGHEQTTEESLDMLGDTLKKYPGEQKVQLHVREKGEIKIFELGKEFNIQVSQNLKNEVSYLFGMNWMN